MVYGPHSGKLEKEKESFWNEVFHLMSCIHGLRRRSWRIDCPCHQWVSCWVYSLILEEQILEQWSHGQVPRLLNRCASCLWAARLCWRTAIVSNLMQVWRPEFELDWINSGSWYHCLPIRIYHWKWEGDSTAVVCELVCCMEVRPGP